MNSMGGNRIYQFFALAILFVVIATDSYSQVIAPKPVINDTRYFERRGLNGLVFNSHYGLFGDEKLSGVEIIQHEVRTATNGDVRLDPTPEQWDSIPNDLLNEKTK